MRNTSFVVFLFVLTLSTTELVAQANLLNARVPQEVGKLNDQQIAANDEDPLPYGFIDDRDVLWSKTIWERIDLDERINFPFYFPSEPGNLGEERRSLFSQTAPLAVLPIFAPEAVVISGEVRPKISWLSTRLVRSMPVTMLPH